MVKEIKLPKLECKKCGQGFDSPHLHQKELGGEHEAMSNDCRLYLGNLEYNATSSEIMAHLADAGKVVKVDIITDRDTGRSKGFAFVEMSTPEEAQKVIKMFNEKDFKGRRLFIDKARPKEERAPNTRPPYR